MHFLFIVIFVNIYAYIINLNIIKHTLRGHKLRMSHMLVVQHSVVNASAIAVMPMKQCM